MSQTTQIAVAGPSAPSRAAIRNQQQNIPRFLLKLYEILSDSTNVALVKWSETGDSFYICNQERFAREILGKWFKHQNFSSFVRQLNLYGFRKISALQQGLLRTDHDSETIQFAHPNFHRGQPDLLALIQRKRNPPVHTQTDTAVSLLQKSVSQAQDGQSQSVDVRSILEGINAIRRQQQAIATELAALKQSNDALWKEAIEARERHAKHEDTINRILKFLAGLFGRAIKGRGSHDRAPTGRLLLGDGRANHGESMGYYGSDAEKSEPGSPHSPLSIMSDRCDNPQTLNSPPTAITEVHEHPHRPPPISLDTIIEESAARVPHDVPTSLSPSGSNSASVWQATLQEMLNSPAQFQQVLNTFAPSSLPPSSALNAPQNPSQQQQWNPYQSTSETFPTNALAITSAPASAAPVDPFTIAHAPLAPHSGTTSQDSNLLNNMECLNKTYRDAEQIRSDVDALQSNLQTLIHNMGLDPQNMAFPAIDHSVAPPPQDQNGLSQGTREFSFDTWLNQLNGAGLPDYAYSGQPDTEDTDFSAFLDLPVIDEGQPTTSLEAAVYPSSPPGTKRKLGALDVPEVPPGDAPLTKKQR